MMRGLQDQLVALCSEADEVMGGEGGAGDPGPHPINPLLVLRICGHRLVACIGPHQLGGGTGFVSAYKDWMIGFKISSSPTQWVYLK